MKKRILIVDDDASIRDSLKKILDDSGYEAETASNADEAAGRFDSGQTDLLLLDLHLAGQSGWDMFERLTTRHPFVPVIIITGMSGQYETALAAGAGALFEKPVEVPALLRTIEELLAEPKENRIRRLCGQMGLSRYAPRTPWFGSLTV